MVKKMGIPARLKEERERVGLSQAALAEKIEATKRSVINWEGGASSPSADVLAKIGRAGLDVLYILTGQRMLPASAAASALEVSAEEACRPYTVADYCDSLEAQSRADLARAGGVTAREAAERLSRDEQILLDNYRHLSAQDKAVLKATSDAFASAARVKGKAG